MGIQKRMEKKMNKAGLGELKFPESMYNNIYGSLVICACMFSEQPYSREDISKKWRNVIKTKGKKITWGIDDEKFIDKTLGFFGVKKPEVFPIAMVMSEYNGLFAPFVEGRVLPIREDGIMSRTLSQGKVYPIAWSKEDVKINNE